MDIVVYHYPATDGGPWSPAGHVGLSGERVPSTLMIGWHRRDTRLWWRGDDGAVVAEAVPAGILLRPGGTYASDASVVVDPLPWTTTVGTKGLSVPAALVAVVRRLVDDAVAEPAGVLVLRVAGETSPAHQEVIAGGNGWALDDGIGIGPAPKRHTTASPCRPHRRHPAFRPGTRTRHPARLACPLPCVSRSGCRRRPSWSRRSRPGP
ncbi:hypothetical protein [Micromonospora sp. NPDC023814]|uniref:hypothetical protein n=1 Tax=Micromonospora sp. NPDC023814 TaxID=3154596 RepID=UPI0033CFCDC6